MGAFPLSVISKEGDLEGHIFLSQGKEEEGEGDIDYLLLVRGCILAETLPFLDSPRGEGTLL